MIPKQWFNGSETAKHFNITVKHLANLRADLTKGVHYRIISKRSAQRPTYRYNIKAIEQFMNKS
jgi:hypothetical protein